MNNDLRSAAVEWTLPCARARTRARGQLKVLTVVPQSSLGPAVPPCSCESMPLQIIFECRLQTK